MYASWDFASTHVKCMGLLLFHDKCSDLYIPPSQSNTVLHLDMVTGAVRRLLLSAETDPPATKASSWWSSKEQQVGGFRRSYGTRTPQKYTIHNHWRNHSEAVFGLQVCSDLFAARTSNVSRLRPQKLAPLLQGGRVSYSGSNTDSSAMTLHHMPFSRRFYPKRLTISAST